ncbi:ribonuclease H-like domain-containing protein [Russula earlei]|uniref:Ribonuclease H-like domain-containing protein n=1 Tax=Russula earlei TaxID=71964 RepID=A0ACC0ULZ3_9AGAM|nr:ribonuclease H-like domain-containing protein [Russula earlei]
MHLTCRRVLACLAVTSSPSQGYGITNKTCCGLLASHSRNISSEPFSPSVTNSPQRPVRSQNKIVGRSTDVSPRHRSAFSSASRNMDPSSDSATPAPYDWRTFAPSHVRLRYITSEDTANARIARMMTRPSPLIVGLDFEWRPTFVAGTPENPIALVQLASEEEILLVHVSAMKAFPTGLRDLLESGSCRKVGVGIQYDCKKVWRDHGVSVRNCVDLSLLARSVDERWKGPYKAGIGLSRLAQTYLKRRVPKGRIQRSDWEMELSSGQQEYAANDSHASLAIYRVLLQRALALAAPPATECFRFDAIKGVLRDDEGQPWFPFNPQYEPGPQETRTERVAGTAAVCAA